jgi:hypothetical protein
MDKLSHTLLYADDTNIILTSTNYNDLQKTVNVTLQPISEWLQLNQLVFNKNKTLPINFSLAKTLTHTLNITLDNQNLTLTESINFSSMHLDTNLSRKLHGKIIEETEYSMLYKKFVLLSDSRLIKDSLFRTFSVIVAT